MAPRPLHLIKSHPHLAAQSWELDSSIPARRVLALHGWLDNAASFDALAAHLKGIHLVALDLPGHGYSEHRSNDASYHFLDWVSDVMRAADELGWDRFTLLGHSMGASIACLAAGTCPDRIEKVVAIEGLTPSTAEEGLLPERLEQHLTERRKLSGKKPALYPDAAAAALARLKASDIKEVKVIEAMVERNLKKSHEGYSWRSDPRLKLPSAWRLTLPQARAFLSRIACPVLVIKARQGIAHDRNELEHSLLAIKNWQLKELAGGHHLHMEQPVEVAAAIQAFFME